MFVLMLSYNLTIPSICWATTRPASLAVLLSYELCGGRPQLLRKSSCMGCYGNESSRWNRCHEEMFCDCDCVRYRLLTPAMNSTHSDKTVKSLRCPRLLRPLLTFPSSVCHGCLPPNYFFMKFLRKNYKKTASNK